MVLINKWIISNRYLHYTPFWWWYRLISHEGFRFDDYHIWTEFWYSINKGYVDTEYKWEFEKFWGNGAKPETMYVSQEAYDELVRRINEPPKFNQKLYDLMSKKSPWEVEE
jgi:hypothetical protein